MIITVQYMLYCGFCWDTMRQLYGSLVRKLKIYEDRDLICFSLYYLSFGDIFNTSRWNSTKDLQDPELQRLASLLPAYCLKSKADNTTTKYRYAFNHFSTWCSSHSNESSKLCHLPASDMTVSLYLIHLVKHTVQIQKSKKQCAPFLERITLPGMIIHVCLH